MEYFGIFEGPNGPFVLISFRSYNGIHSECDFVINTMVLQNLQNYASCFGLQNYASQKIFKNSILC